MKFPHFDEEPFLAANGYCTTTADGLLDWIKHGTELPGNTVILTFDDGADNFYRVAYPLLRQYNQTAVLFIAPGLHRTADEEPWDSKRPCTWEELSEMHRSGLVDIQSHTWEHRSLQQWPTPQPLAGIPSEHLKGRRSEPIAMLEDLLLARRTIEDRLEKSVQHLAWPCYYSEHHAFKVAKNAGYKAFWTGTLPRLPIITPGHDPKKIVRISGEFIKRLPGDERESLYSILKHRYKNVFLTMRTKKL